MELSIVIPSYNEGEHIYDNLMDMASDIEAFCTDYELVPVNDGSKDNTASEINRAAQAHPHIHPVSYEDNRGKGQAVKAGVLASSGKYIGFLDADLDLSAKHFDAFLKRIKSETEPCNVVIGSKMHKDSKLDYPPIRKLFSFSFYVILKVLFGMRCKDTQTGVKLFDGALIKDIVSKQRVKGYAFDVEQLALASHSKGVIAEMPIVLEYRRGESFGRIKMKDIWKMFSDTVGVWWNLRMKKNY